MLNITELKINIELLKARSRFIYNIFLYFYAVFWFGIFTYVAPIMVSAEFIIEEILMKKIPITPEKLQWKRGLQKPR